MNSLRKDMGEMGPDPGDELRVEPLFTGNTNLRSSTFYLYTSSFFPYSFILFPCLVRPEGFPFDSSRYTTSGLAQGENPAVARDLILVRPEGFKPPTLGSEDQCSIQLSYGRNDSQAF